MLSMDKEVIIRRMRDGLTTLYESEGELIRNRTNEETIVSHLVEYLRSSFVHDGWSVDTEYNRDGTETKHDSHGNRISPDIIIHRRTSEREKRCSPADNLVAIEVKGYWNREDRNIDAQKLRDMRKRYGYRYLFQVELKADAGELIEVC
jgi:hypothetical protein